MIVIETRLLTETEWAVHCEFADETDRDYFEGFVAHLNSQSPTREYRVQPEVEPEPPAPGDPVEVGFRVDLHLWFPITAWQATYGGEPTVEGVIEWAESSLFVGTAQVTTTVNAVIADDE